MLADDGVLQAHLDTEERGSELMATDLHDSRLFDIPLSEIYLFCD